MRFLFLTLIICLATGTTAQQSIPVEIEQAYCRKLGTTERIDNIIAQRTAVSKIAQHKANRPSEPNNFMGALPSDINLQGTPFGPDPLMQDMSGRLPWTPASPIFNVEGISRVTALSGVSDVNGDVSDKYYVQSVNGTVIQVFDLLGNAASDTFTTNAIWSQLDVQGIGDPIVLFDHHADRWLLTELTFSNEVLVAISESDDPLGAWTVYALPTQGFPDYPKYGVWPDMYLVTTNETSSSGVAFYAIRKEDLLAGEPIVNVQRFALNRTEHPGVEVAAPVGWIGDIEPDSSVSPMVIRINDDAWEVAPEDRIELFEVNVDWDTLENSSVVETLLPTTPFAAEFCEATANIFVCVPQPGEPFISAIPRVLWHRVSYRNFGDHGSIVLNFGVDATGEKDAGIRWTELQKSGDEPWQIQQEGTIGSSDGENRFLGAISIDSKGNIGIGYAVSSERTFPSLRYTGRRFDDPLGMMTLRETEIATGLSISNTPRFGDYHSMSVDDQDMFWFTGQYVSKANFWSTKVMAFKVVRDSVDIGPSKVNNPRPDSGLGLQDVLVDVRNYGSDSISSFVIGLDMKGVSIIDTVSITPLATDSVYTHTFSEQVDFDRYGTFELSIYTQMDSDSNQVNDTCVTELRIVAPNDAAVYNFEQLRSVECSDNFVSDATFVNEGSEEINVIGYRVLLNGDEVLSDVIESSLAPRERIILPVSLQGLSEGSNSIEVQVVSVNGLPDQVGENDTLRLSQEVMLSGEPAELELTTDFFPEDTRWELQDMDGAVLYSGGPYTEVGEVYIEDWCIDQSECYRFIVFDEGGDGLEYAGVEGDWRIFNSDGIAVALLSDPAFGDVDTTDFCFESSCTISARAFVTQESTPSANNGVINFVTFGGQAPYEYSIDGGLTFQTSPLFPGLAPGQYSCIVRDRLNCPVVFDLSVLECLVQATIDVTEATGSDIADGAIQINASDGRGAYRYSIDGGSSFQPEPLFENLLPDTFAIEVRDSVNCGIEDEVIVDFTTSVRDIALGTSVKVYPNPSSEVFNIELHGMSDAIVVDFEVIDLQGKVVLQETAGSFNGIIKAAFSLRAHPDGSYFVRFLHPKVKSLIPVVKTGR